MPRSQRDVRELRLRAVNSLVLAIELFNRPHEQGRPDTVLMLLQHSFEMLLKAIILERTGAVHDKERKYSFGFDRCLEIVHNQLKLIDSDGRRTLSTLDALRDVSVHYYQHVSEDLLYVQTQSAVTLFDDVLSRAFQEKLADVIPSRVLPVSTRPPRDLQLLLDSDLTQVDELLKAGSRKGAQAAAKLRPILAFAAAAREKAERVSERELQNALKRRKKGQKAPCPPRMPPGSLHIDAGNPPSSGYFPKSCVPNTNRVLHFYVIRFFLSHVPVEISRLPGLFCMVLSSDWTHAAARPTTPSQKPDV